VEISSKGTLRVRHPQLVGEQPSRLRVRLRLVGLTVLLLAVPVSAAAWFIDGTLEMRQLNHVDAALAATLGAANAGFRTEVDRIEATTRAVASSRSLQAALLRRDRRALLPVARANPNMSFFAGSRRLAGLPIAAGALRRSIEVVAGDRSIGRVVSSLPLDENLLRRLQAGAALDSDAVLLRAGGTRVIAGPIGAGEPLPLELGRAEQVRLSGVDYRALTSPLIGDSSVRLAAALEQRGIAQSAAQTRRSIVLASIATLMALALAAHLIAPGAQRRARRRRKRDDREAMALLGSALAASHDRRALQPVVLATMVEATGAVGGRLFEDAFEVARHGDLSADKEPFRLTLNDGSTDSRLVLYPPPRGFSSADRSLADLLAGQASIALENARLHAIARYEAVTDPLTGLANRRRFMEVLDLELSRAQRYGRVLSLILIDLDDFKAINDDHGHAAGDDVLCAVAGTLLGGVREHDVPARLGGEELAVLLPETNLAGATVLAERLRLQMLELRLTSPASQMQPTASFGVASRPPAGTAEALLGAADAALYRAKRHGKNCVRAADEPTLDRSSRGAAGGARTGR
jgi:diguanylate cyclase (GGDEF)-like protein